MAGHPLGEFADSCIVAAGQSIRIVVALTREAQPSRGEGNGDGGRGEMLLRRAALSHCVTCPGCLGGLGGAGEEWAAVLVVGSVSKK